MSHDLHVSVLPGTEHLFGKCQHCGKPMERSLTHRYASNACKQAAYRKRMQAILAHPDEYVTYKPNKTRNAAPCKRFRGKQKGGAR